MKAPAALQSRSGAHHSAASSGDGTSTHTDSPRVVEHAIAGDLFIAQVRFPGCCRCFGKVALYQTKEL